MVWSRRRMSGSSSTSRMRMRRSSPTGRVWHGLRSGMVRFGLQIPNFTLGVPDDQLFERVAGMAVAAEESGFDSVWVMDHFYQLPPLGGTDQPMLVSTTLHIAIDAQTNQVRHA